MLLPLHITRRILEETFWDHTLFQHEDTMLQSIWFAGTLLFLILLTLVVCITILYFILRQNKSDQATSEQIVQILSKMSDQQVYITDRHVHMTDILATVSNEFLRLRQDKDKDKDCN